MIHLCYDLIDMMSYIFAQLKNSLEMRSRCNGKTVKDRGYTLAFYQDSCLDFYVLLLLYTITQIPELTNTLQMSVHHIFVQELRDETKRTYYLSRKTSTLCSWGFHWYRSMVFNPGCITNP